MISEAGLSEGESMLAVPLLFNVIGFTSVMEDSTKLVKTRVCKVRSSSSNLHCVDFKMIL